MQAQVVPAISGQDGASEFDRSRQNQVVINLLIGSSIFECTQNIVAQISQMLNDCGIDVFIGVKVGCSIRHCGYAAWFSAITLSISSLFCL